MLVQWTTHNSSRPEVRWGSKKSVQDRTAPATSSSYSREDMCGGIATSVSQACNHLQLPSPHVSRLACTACQAGLWDGPSLPTPLRSPPQTGGLMRVG